MGRFRLKNLDCSAVTTRRLLTSLRDLRLAPIHPVRKYWPLCLSRCLRPLTKQAHRNLCPKASQTNPSRRDLKAPNKNQPTFLRTLSTYKHSSKIQWNWIETLISAKQPHRSTKNECRHSQDRWMPQQETQGTLLSWLTKRVPCATNPSCRTVTLSLTIIDPTQLMPYSY